MTWMTEEEFLDAHNLVCFEPDEMYIDDFELMAKCRAVRATTGDERDELAGAP